MPNSHKSRGEFGIREIHYVNYRYAVVGEIAIGFSANRVQKASYPMPNSYRSRGEFGIREIRYVSYPYAVVGEMAKRFHLIVSNRHRILCRIRIKVGALGCWQAMASCPLASQCTQKTPTRTYILVGVMDISFIC